MSDKAIISNNLGKCFQIGTASQANLRHAIGDKFRNIMRPGNVKKEEFWALRNLDFEIGRGEAIGIIGRNGAGKSTLLKILSRITEPSEGRFEINGRVSSLLEVGTGFHPELSGRENIYLNGTILGMRRKEIKAKFDEIVDFSGVAKFIDTPVKHYSSGMKVRLAFSVAAHLEPEILIVDEVLAVGDAEFQKKCLGKMNEVSKNEGRTVLFVSHNMGAVESLCQRGLYLNQGQIVKDSDIKDTIITYLQNAGESEKNGEWNFEKGAIQKVEMYSDGIKSANIVSGSNMKISVHFNSDRVCEDIVLGFTIRTSTGQDISSFNNRNVGQRINTIAANKGRIDIEIENMNLYREEKYWMDIYLGDLNEDFETILGEVSFQVISSDVYKSKKVLRQDSNIIFFPNIKYSLNE